MTENRGVGLSRGRGSIKMNQPTGNIDTAETKLQDFYFKFASKNWTPARRTMLMGCEEKGVSFIKAQQKLLEENYNDIWQLKEFLKYNSSSPDKISAEFDCELDGFLICHMKCSADIKISMAETINVEVKWNPKSIYERTEHWVLETRKFATNRLRVLNVARDKSPVSFSFMSHDMSNTFSTSASACRTATLREMRACLASWSDSLLS